MSGLLLAGLSDRDAATIELMVGMTWNDLPCITLKRGRLPFVPAQDQRARACRYCVIDLAGLGLRQHSVQNQARLLDLLEGRPAVLLTHGDGDGWPEACRALAADHTLVTLARPHGSAALKSALQQVMAMPPSGRPAASPRTDTVAGRPGAAANGNARAASPAARRPANGGTVRQPPKQAADAVVGLTRGGFEQLLQVFPALRTLPLMRLIGQVLEGQGGHLVRLGPSTFVMDFRAGWLASAYPVSPALMRMLHQRLDSLTVEPLPSNRIEQALQTHFPQASQRVLRPLDVITWELVSGALGQSPLEPERDLVFQLWRSPNFTQLHQVGPLDVQLAAICARSPQSLQQLLRVFPQHAQQVCRFCILAVVSGLAVVFPAGISRRDAGLVPVGVPPPMLDNRRRGFLKSLLQRLF